MKFKIKTEIIEFLLMSICLNMFFRQYKVASWGSSSLSLALNKLKLNEQDYDDINISDGTINEDYIEYIILKN